MRSVLSAILFLSALSLAGQSDRVYLKNGSLVRGDLLRIDSKQLVMDIGESDPLKLSFENLRFVKVNRKKTALTVAGVKAADSLNRSLRPIKLSHLLRVGVITGEDGTTWDEVSTSSISLDYTLFYPVKDTWSVGLGVGFDQYSTFEAFPFTLEIRKDWGVGPSPLFAYLKAGIARAGARDNGIGQESTVRGQELIAFGLGQQWALGKNAMFVSVGFRRQSLQSSWSAGDFRSVTDWNLNRLDMKVGFIF